MRVPGWLAVLAVSATMTFTGLPPAAAAPETVRSASVLSPSAAKTVQTIKTTDNLNLRKNPGTKYAVVTTLKKGTVVTRTGKASGKWWQVKAGKYTGWVSSDYLKTTTAPVNPAPKPDPKPVAKPSVGASRWIDGTQGLYARATPKSKRLMAQAGGTKVKLLKASGKWSYVQAPTGKGWIESSELATSEDKANGNSKTHRWTVVTSNVRKGPSLSYATLGTIPANQKVGYLKTSNGWSHVKTSRGTGWIKNTQLTMIEYHPPKKLQPKTRTLIADVKKRYGKQLIGVGGVRSGSTGHSAGVAADFMVKNYSSASGIKAGDKMAAYLVANHKRLNINYMIWRDKIWLSYDGQWGEYSKGGWGKHLEGSRGWNVTTRHMDHIHAEVTK